MNELNKPKTALQEVLYTLIEQGYVSIFDFSWMSGFRTRVSDLKLEYNLNIETEKKQKINKFGNTYTYCLHVLPYENRKEAIDLYKSLNNG